MIQLIDESELRKLILFMIINGRGWVITRGYAYIHKLQAIDTNDVKCKVTKMPHIKRTI